MIAFSLMEHVCHVPRPEVSFPGEDPRTIKQRKLPGFADHLDCWGGLGGGWAGSLTQFGKMTPACLAQASLFPLSLGSPRPTENPRSDLLWIMWQVSLEGNFSRGATYYCPGLGLHRWASPSNSSR